MSTLTDWIGSFWGGRGSGGTPGLEAGSKNIKRMAKINPSTVHINALLASSGATVLARSRYLERNNPYAGSAADGFAAHIVGPGMMPSWQIENDTLRAAGKKLFNRWAKYADNEGVSNFWGLQNNVMRELFVAGEAFVRKRPRYLSDGLPVPFQLQLIPAEMLPLHDNRVLPNGNKVRQGVEFNRLGKRVSYHFLKTHPGDYTEQTVFSDERTIVPAAEILHVYERREFNQIRGLPRLSRTITKLFQLDMYDEAELDRKRVAALFGGFITRKTKESDLEDDDDTVVPVERDPTDTRESAIAPMSPGGLQVLGDDEDVTFAEPADVGANYDKFQFRVLTAIAVAIGIPYAYLTGDMSAANYSSMRAALIHFRKLVVGIQDSVLVHQFCQPVFDWFLDEAVAAGKLSLPGYVNDKDEYRDVKWVPPRWEYMDPQKDANADITLMKEKIIPPSEIIEGRGYDTEETYEAIARDERLRKKNNIKTPDEEKAASAAVIANNKNSQPGNEPPKARQPAKKEDAA